MAISINKDELSDGDFTPESHFVPAGNNPAVCVYYAELGKHQPIFKGKPAVYDTGKRIGQLKDPEMIVHVVFEFPLCDYDNVPLTIRTSVPLKDGSFINKLPVSDALASGNISLTMAMRSAYMKYLTAMNNAAGFEAHGIHEHVGSKFLVNVTNKTVTKDDKSVTYANMKPEGITKPEFRHPMTGKIEEVEVPDAIGTYGPVFAWDDPTEEAWKAMPDFLKKCCKKASNFEGSPLQVLLSGMPDENSDPISGDETPDNTPPAGPPAQPESDDLPV